MIRQSSRFAASAAIVLALVAAVPLVGVLALSLRPRATLVSVSDLLPPLAPQVASYVEVLGQPGFAMALFNSSVVAASMLISNLALGTLTAFAFLRISDASRRLVVVSAIIAIAAPQQALVVPLFLVFTQWSLLDSYAALIIPGLVAPTNLLLLFHAIRTIPPSLLEAAAIDGAGDAYLLRRVVAPLLRPTLVIVAINTFVASWSSFLLPFLLTSSASRRTLPVALALLKNEEQVRWSIVAAGATITAIPVAIVFFLARRRLLDAVMSGAVKG